MKNFSEYILEKRNLNESTSSDEVWVIKDKDLDGAILDVCSTEDDANKAYEEHMKENPDSHLEITHMKKSEVEKN